MKKILSIIGLAVFILFMAAGIFLIFNFDNVLRAMLQYSANASTREYFAGSIRLSTVHLDQTLRLHMLHAEGYLQTRAGPVKIQIRSMDSLDPVTHLLFQKAFRFHFEGAKPAVSPREGLQGNAVVVTGRKGFVELTSDVVGMNLEDITWFNPENLAGSSGRMTGTITFKTTYQEETSFRMALDVKEPGGNLQARFFELLRPYLPQLGSNANFHALTNSLSLVNYRKASLQMYSVDSDKMKVHFHILVPEYNLNLNVNVEIRTDEKNYFFKLAQMMGFVEVKSQ
ncbi:MAG: hypothetical protein PHN49_01835 [Candidatus Omnitrophica bacterium]|nr:hypothetical protein [Candidatus Omnitrophota bacterium]MDD5670359.1 hypothetical protein [Candidatus Omnitrophota bacterium]